METVNFIAQLWGFSLIIACFALLIRPKHVQNILALAENETWLLATSLVKIVVGFASVLSYNVWDSSWKTIIALLGWVLIVKAVVCLFMPELVIKKIIMLKTQYMNMVPLVLVAGVVLGCILVYLGATY